MYILHDGVYTIYLHQILKTDQLVCYSDTLYMALDLRCHSGILYKVHVIRYCRACDYKIAHVLYNIGNKNGGQIYQIKILQCKEENNEQLIRKIRNFLDDKHCG